MYSYIIYSYLILQGHWHFDYIIQNMARFNKKAGTKLDYSFIK